MMDTGYGKPVRSAIIDFVWDRVDERGRCFVSALELKKVCKAKASEIEKEIRVLQRFGFFSERMFDVSRGKRGYFLVAKERAPWHLSDAERGGILAEFEGDEDERIVANDGMMYGGSSEPKDASEALLRMVRRFNESTPIR